MLNPPKPKPMPLNSARAFEAAARLNGFKSAAEELNVTPGAVAQQIKSLEDWAGISLFHRKAQGVELTSEGNILFKELRSAFDTIGSASLKLQRAERRKQINIAALPAIAQFWLSPRLKNVRDISKDVQISITALESPPNLLREPYDIAIFYHKNPIGKSLTPIYREELFPVCSPNIANDLTEIKDLEKQPILHDSTWNKDWQIWLESTKSEFTLINKGAIFSLYSLAIQEAKNGAGVLMGHQSLVQPFLDEGSLVAPFSDSLKTENYLCIETLGQLRKGSLIGRIVDAISEQ